MRGIPEEEIEESQAQIELNYTLVCEFSLKMR
jgi:hypothetical protein